MRPTVLLLALIVLPVGLRAQGTLTPAEAARHIGETATVCGVVASATYARQSRGQPTFINLDRAYPNQIFTILIWGSDRGRFSAPPEVHYANAHICVTGPITAFRGMPEIVVHDSSAIRPSPARTSQRRLTFTTPGNRHSFASSDARTRQELGSGS